MLFAFLNNGCYFITLYLLKLVFKYFFSVKHKFYLIRFKYNNCLFKEYSCVQYLNKSLKTVKNIIRKLYRFSEIHIDNKNLSK